MAEVKESVKQQLGSRRGFLLQWKPFVVGFRLGMFPLILAAISPLEDF